MGKFGCGPDREAPPQSLLLAHHHWTLRGVHTHNCRIPAITDVGFHPSLHNHSVHLEHGHGLHNGLHCLSQYRRCLPDQEFWNFPGQADAATCPVPRLCEHPRCSLLLLLHNLICQHLRLMLKCLHSHGTISLNPFSVVLVHHHH